EQLVEADHHKDLGEPAPHLGSVQVADAVGTGAAGPPDQLVVVSARPSGGREHHALVVELGGEHLPAAVDLAHHHVGGHAHVRVVGGVEVVRAVAGDDRGVGEARVGGVDDEDGQAPVAGVRGAGARGEPDVVGVVSSGGPHLLAVDDPVAGGLVALGGGAQRGEVGAGVGL